MLQDCRLKDFGERLTSLLRAAVLPAALSSHCYASFAPRRSGRYAPRSPAEEAALTPETFKLVESCRQPSGNQL